MRTTNFFKLTLGLFFLSIFVVKAENPVDKLNPENPSELNRDYIENVSKNATLSESQFLSEIISEWDVKSTDEFDSRNMEYTVRFKSNKGVAYVNYDQNGRIMDVNKQFKNVALPRAVLSVLATDYPDWRHIKNRYTVKYKKGTEVRKSYVLTLEKGDETIKVRLKG